MNKAYAAYKKACRDISIFNAANYEDMTTSNLNKLKRKLTKCKEKRQIFLDRCIYGIPMQILNDPQFPAWEYTLQKIEEFINENGEKAFLEKSDTMRSLNIKENPDWELLSQGDEKMIPNTAHELPIYRLLLQLNEVDRKLDYLESIGEFEKIDAQEEEDEEEEEPEVDIDILAEWNREAEEINSILSERAEQKMQDEETRRKWLEHRDILNMLRNQIHNEDEQIRPDLFFDAITSIIQRYKHDPSKFDRLRNFDKETYDLVLDFVNFRGDFDKQIILEQLIPEVYIPNEQLKSYIVRSAETFGIAALVNYVRETILWLHSNTDAEIEQFIQEKFINPEPIDEPRYILIHLLIMRIISEYEENMVSFSVWKECPGHNKNKKKKKEKNITQGGCQICVDRINKHIINNYLMDNYDVEGTTGVHSLNVSQNLKNLHVILMHFIRGKFMIHQSKRLAMAIEKNGIQGTHEFMTYLTTTARTMKQQGRIPREDSYRDQLREALRMKTQYQDVAEYLQDSNETNDSVNAFHTAIFTDEALAWYGLKFIDRQRGLISVASI